MLAVSSGCGLVNYKIIIYSLFSISRVVTQLL